MREVNPEFIKEVQQEGKKKLLYLRALKALYICIESALLWYNLYTDTMEKEGFVLNIYDKCTAYKMINRKQYTIQWYIDNNKVTHISEEVITEVIYITKIVFGNTFLCMEI